MEKYTKESLAKMTPEELENVVLKLQDEMGKEVETKNMYYDWYNREQKDKDALKAKLNTLHNLMHTWE